MSKRYGVVDIGTLKVKVLIAEMGGEGRIRKIYKSNNLTCFGVGMDETGGLVQEKYLEETVKELRRVKKMLNKLGVEKFKVVSTHAMRRAKNQKEILQRIKDKVGFEVENLSQEDEARLFYQAVMRGFGSQDKKYCVADIGGGSVQVLIGTPRRLKTRSLMQTGAQYLHDNFTIDPHNELSFTREEELEKMREYISVQLLPIERGLQVPIIYGSSNIIDLMKAIKMPLESFDESATHPYKVYARHLREFIKRVGPLNYKQREEKYPFQWGYMWGIDKAFLNAVALAEHLDSPYIIPSNANIAEGIIQELESSR